MTTYRSRTDRRRFLSMVPALPAALRVALRPNEPSSFLVSYVVATFAEAEGWLLLVDDDVSGSTDWRAGVLTYDFRRGATFLALDNRLPTLRGQPESVGLTIESDGGGHELGIRLRDRTGQYFDTTIARLDQVGVLDAERSLQDIGSAAWQVFGGPTDRVPRPPFMVKAVLLTPGSGRPYGTMRLRELRVRTRLDRAEGLRIRLEPDPAGDSFTLTAENLLPVPAAVTVAHGLVSLDGTPLARGVARLNVAGGAGITQRLPVQSAGGSVPPVVQLAAQASTATAIESAHASLVRTPMPLPAQSLSHAGVHTALSSRVLPREMARLAGLVAACGAGWIREDFNWQQISPLSSRVSVRRHDRAIDAANAADLRVLGLPTNWPFWTHPYSTQGIREYTAFLAIIARRYRGRVAAWEIWNEPNLPTVWHGSPEQYVELLAAAYATLKGIDPSVLVVGLCAAGPGDLSNPASLAALDWIDRVLQAGPPFDVFSFHPYEGRRSPEQAGLVDTVDRLRRLLRAHNRMPRIWITEQGWASDYVNPTLDDVQQARLLVRAYLLSQAAGVENFFWYDARNDGLATDDHEDNYGLLRRDFVPKAAHRALAVVAQVLGRQRFAGTLAVPSGMFALRFVPAAGGGPSTLAVWSHQAPATLQVTAGPRGGLLRDIDGSTASLAPGSQPVRLPAGLVRFVTGEIAVTGATGR